MVMAPHILTAQALDARLRQEGCDRRLGMPVPANQRRRGLKKGLKQNDQTGVHVLLARAELPPTHRVWPWSSSNSPESASRQQYARVDPYFLPLDMSRGAGSSPSYDDKEVVQTHRRSETVAGFSPNCHNDTKAELFTTLTIQRPPNSLGTPSFTRDRKIPQIIAPTLPIRAGIPSSPNSVTSFGTALSSSSLSDAGSFHSAKSRIKRLRRPPSRPPPTTPLPPLPFLQEPLSSVILQSISPSTPILTPMTPEDSKLRGHGHQLESPAPASSPSFCASGLPDDPTPNAESGGIPESQQTTQTERPPHDRSSHLNFEFGGEDIGLLADSLSSSFPRSPPISPSISLESMALSRESPPSRVDPPRSPPGKKSRRRINKHLLVAGPTHRLPTLSPSLESFLFLESPPSSPVFDFNFGPGI